MGVQTLYQLRRKDKCGGVSCTNSSRSTCSCFLWAKHQANDPWADTKIFVIKRAKISKSQILAKSKEDAVRWALQTLNANEILIGIKEKT